MPVDVIVLASGPSVQAYNLRDLEMRGKLIALNGAALYVKPHIALTMDRLVAEHCYPLWKIQGIPQIWLRSCIAKNFVPTPDTKLFQHTGSEQEQKTHMTLVAGALNGSNSGTCALNLAYTHFPDRLFLLGFDMQRGDKPLSLPYWHPPYPWNTTGAPKNGKLGEWAREYEEISAQFKHQGTEVFNVNHRSRVEAFPIISYKDFERMTRWN